MSWELQLRKAWRVYCEEVPAEQRSADAFAEAVAEESGSVAAGSGAMPLTPMSIEEQEQELRQWLRDHGSVAFAEAQAQRARNAGSGAGI